MRISLAVCLALALVSPACKKAQYLVNDRGGYTLMTESGTIDQAIVRFRRRASDLCGGTGRFAMSDPEIMDKGWGSELTLRSEITCR